MAAWTVVVVIYDKKKLVSRKDALHQHLGPVVHNCGVSGILDQTATLDVH